MKVTQLLDSESIVVQENSTIADLCKVFVKSEFKTAAILDENRRIKGIISLHDILANIIPYHVRIDNRLADALHEGYFEEGFAKIQNSLVSEFMNTKIDTLHVDDNAIKAVAVFVECKRRALPVLNDDGIFQGFVTRVSLLEHLTGEE